MITALYAGLLGLVYFGLTVIVIKGRFKHKVNLGDAQNDDMTRRIRAHANFGEYVPFALILIFFLENQQTSAFLIHGLGGALLLARLMHPFGIMHTTGISILRSGGAIITFLVLIIASISNLLFFL